MKKKVYSFLLPEPLTRFSKYFQVLLNKTFSLFSKGRFALLCFHLYSLILSRKNSFCRCTTENQLKLYMIQKSREERIQTFNFFRILPLDTLKKNLKQNWFFEIF